MLVTVLILAGEYGNQPAGSLQHTHFCKNKLVIWSQKIFNWHSEDFEYLLFLCSAFGILDM